MIRILYATRVNLCLRRAHAHNILKTVELFGQSRGMGAMVVSSGKQSCAFEEIMSRHGVRSPIRFLRTRFFSRFCSRREKIYGVLAPPARGLISLTINRNYM